jgi:peptidoglycan/xylan/chitin deacetylase (PgdA/CDA1 family)
MQWLAPVQHALDATPADIELFFRDDDAGWDDDRLLDLLELFDRHELPLDLAVIPAALGRGLAGELRGRAGERLGLHQHGFAHRNHERKGRRYEFGPSRTRDSQRRDIEAGAERLAQLLGDVVEPIFTPPWNRCTPATGRCLVELGFRVLSRESRAEPLGLTGLSELPVAIDWVRLAPHDVAARLATAIDQGGPVGVMFHHAEMDRADRERAGELLGVLAAHPRSRPRPMRMLA